MGQYINLNTEPGKTVQLFNFTDWSIYSVQLSFGQAVIGNKQTLTMNTGVPVSTTPRYIIAEPGETVYVYSDAVAGVSLIAQPMPFILKSINDVVCNIEKLGTIIRTIFKR